MFFLTEFTDVCNFADDTTFFACDSYLKDLMERQEHDTKWAIEWFENNYMKLNQSKGHLNIGETKIWESNNEKLLGLAIDRNLNIDDQVFIFCKKFGRKLSALSRTSNCVSFEKKKNSFKNICGITFWVLLINLQVYGGKSNSKIFMKDL